MYLEKTILNENNETKETILFLHGSMVSGWMWTEQVNDLKAEFNCLVPDLPGFDKSGHEKWVSFSDAADKLADVCLSEGYDQVHVVGLSLGGIVGLFLAARHPRFVKSLMVSGVPKAEGKMPLYIRALSGILLFLYVRPWGARIVARIFGMPDKESVNAFVDSANNTDPDALRIISRDVSIQTFPDEIRLVEAPTIAVVGEKDTSIAKRGALAIAQQVSGATHVLVKNVGHQWNAENPKLFSKIVRSWVSERKLPNSSDIQQST